MKNEQLNNYIDDEDNTIQLPDVVNSPEEEIVLKEKLKLTLEAIPTLKKKHRDLIQARMEGLSYKEIGEKLAMNELTVKSELNKARSKLKQKTNYH
jgi:RNA polymerase sigma factor (sigma-70 family)